MPEVVVRRHAETFQPAPHVECIRPVEQGGDAGMLTVGRSVDGLRLGHAVRLPDLLHVKRGEHYALGIAKGQGLASGQALGRRLGKIEDHRDRPELT